MERRLEGVGVDDVVEDDTPHKFTCDIETADYRDFLDSRVDKGSVDLILTDPPYSISKETGFKSGGIKKLGVSMDFGKWDHQEIDLTALAKGAHRVLRKGGSVIIFYDLWKITKLAEALVSAGFGKLRMIEWIKTNPVPLNSKRTYLNNAREVAVSAVKGNCKATFHGKYDNGCYYQAPPDDPDNGCYYYQPIPGGKRRDKRIHNTQKPIQLMCDLIKKHSNPEELVVDAFLGSGTTAVAAQMEGRRFIGCDIDEGYCEAARDRVKGLWKG